MSTSWKPTLAPAASCITGFPKHGEHRPEKESVSAIRGRFQQTWSDIYLSSKAPPKTGRTWGSKKAAAHLEESTLNHIAQLPPDPCAAEYGRDEFLLMRQCMLDAGKLKPSTDTHRLRCMSSDGKLRRITRTRKLSLGNIFSMESTVSSTIDTRSNHSDEQGSASTSVKSWIPTDLSSVGLPPGLSDAPAQLLMNRLLMERSAAPDEDSASSSNEMGSASEGSRHSNYQCISPSMKYCKKVLREQGTLQPNAPLFIPGLRASAPEFFPSKQPQTGDCLDCEEEAMPNRFVVEDGQVFSPSRRVIEKEFMPGGVFWEDEEEVMPRVQAMPDRLLVEDGIVYSPSRRVLENDFMPGGVFWEENPRSGMMPPIPPLADFLAHIEQPVMYSAEDLLAEADRRTNEWQQYCGLMPDVPPNALPESLGFWNHARWMQETTVQYAQCGHM